MPFVEPKQPEFQVSLLNALVSGLGAVALNMENDIISNLLDGRVGIQL